MVSVRKKLGYYRGHNKAYRSAEKKGGVGYMTPGKRIKSLRETQRYTRDELAEMTDISCEDICEIENDTQEISADMLLSLSESLHVSMEFIMTGVGPEQYDMETSKLLGKFNSRILKSILYILEEIHKICKGIK